MVNHFKNRKREIS